jgi:hypothetical protein
MYALRGRQVSFYLPTFNNQLTVTQQLNNGTANSCSSPTWGTGRFVQARAGPQHHPASRKTDGTLLVRKFSAPPSVSLHRGAADLDAYVAGNIPVAQVANIDFYEKVRFDSDRITFQHLRPGRLQVSAP